MQSYVIPLLIHLFPAYLTFLTYAGLYAFISGGTLAVRKIWQQWAKYRKYPDTDLTNPELVFTTVVLGLVGPAVALTITGQIYDPVAVAHAAKVAGAVVLASNGLYSIVHHTGATDAIKSLFGK